MIIDLWTLAIVWQACGLIAMARWARKYHRLTLADVMAFVLLGALWLIVDSVICLMECAEKIQLWKQEA